MDPFGRSNNTRLRSKKQKGPEDQFDSVLFSNRKAKAKPIEEVKTNTIVDGKRNLGVERLFKNKNDQRPRSKNNATNRITRNVTTSSSIRDQPKRDSLVKTNQECRNAKELVQSRSSVKSYRTENLDLPFDRSSMNDCKTWNILLYNTFGTTKIEKNDLREFICAIKKAGGLHTYCAKVNKQSYSKSKSLTVAEPSVGQTFTKTLSIEENCSNIYNKSGLENHEAAIRKHSLSSSKETELKNQNSYVYKKNMLSSDKHSNIETTNKTQRRLSNTTSNYYGLQNNNVEYTTAKISNQDTKILPNHEYTSETSQICVAQNKKAMIPSPTCLPALQQTVLIETTHDETNCNKPVLIDNLKKTNLLNSIKIGVKLKNISITENKNQDKNQRDDNPQVLDLISQELNKRREIMRMSEIYDMNDEEDTW